MESGSVEKTWMESEAGTEECEVRFSVESGKDVSCLEIAYFVVKVAQCIEIW